MFQFKPSVNFFFSAILISTITACGGGSASDQDDYGPQGEKPAINSISASSATEGDTLYFSVTLSATASQRETYDFNLSNITTSNNDLGAVSISGGSVDYTNGKLFIDSGISSFNFVVASTDDSISEGNETFMLTIETQSANGNIVDNDGTSRPTVSPIANVSADEGDSLVFNVSLSGASTNDEIYPFAITDVSTDSSDYGTVSFSNGVTRSGQSITVNAGVTGFSVTVAGAEDVTLEGNETFLLTVDGQSANGTIIDNEEAPPPTINAINSSSASEGDTLVFNISLSAASNTDQIYPFSITNQTTDDNDYGVTTFGNGALISNQSVVVSAGTTSFTMSIAGMEDSNVEGNETLSISVGGQTAVGTIINDDSDLTFTSDLVLYAADQENDGKFELYTHSISSDERNKINQTLVSCEIITGVTWAEDQSRLFFSGDQDTEGTIELYSVLANGSNLIKLNGTLVADGNIEQFKPSPNNLYIAYIADQDTDGIDELYTVRFDGTNNTKVSGALTSGGNVTEFMWSEDGTKLSYLADANTNDQFELFAVDSDGSNRNQLNGSLVSGGNVIDWVWLPDSTSIIYRADEVANEREELFVVDSDGSNNISLNSSLVSSGDTQAEWTISPSGAEVLYLADHDTSNLFELFVVNVGTTNVVKINDPLPSGGEISHWAWAPDNSKISYVSDEVSTGVFDLYTNDPDGSNKNRLNTDVLNGESFNDVQWAPDSSRVFFSAPLDTASTVELYSVSPDGTLLSKLNDTLPSGVSLSENDSWAVSPDSSSVSYQVDQSQPGTTELFVVPADGSQVAIKLNSDLTSGGDVLSFSWASDSQQLLYLADQDNNGVDELYWVSVDGLSSSKMNGALVNGGDVVEFSWVD